MLYTHLFNPNLINQFNPGASWYSSIFEPNNYAQSLQTYPIVLASGSDSVPLRRARTQSLAFWLLFLSEGRCGEGRPPR
jgi:hypothetical protein